MDTNTNGNVLLTNTYTVVSFLVSKAAWQQQRDIVGLPAAEIFAANEHRRFNVYKVKIYNSVGDLVKELI